MHGVLAALRGSRRGKPPINEPMTMDPVTTKANFVKRYAKGEFGNCSPTWDSLDTLDADDYDWPPGQLFHIRNRVAGGVTWYDLNSWQMIARWEQLELEGVAKSFYISCMCPTERTTFQGEVQQLGNHLSLFYSQVRKPMRASLLEGGRQVSGAVVPVMLRHFMDGTSYDWLQYLLEAYNGHVVEFTCLEVPWGTLNWNTLFWEVRGGY